MSSSYFVPVDPIELSSRIPDPRSLEDIFDEDIEEETVAVDLATFDNEYGDRILPLLNRIPEKEADFIDLYYIQKKKQSDIATIFNITQAAVSYRLDRGIQRIKFILDMPEFTEEQLREDLSKIFSKPMDVDILVGMWKTTCQSEVATQLGLTQGRVRHRFLKARDTLARVAEQDEAYKPHHYLFDSISKNFNIMRSVVLPQWTNKDGDVCF